MGRVLFLAEGPTARALLVALTLAAAVLGATAVGEPPVGEEATWELAALSLVRDGDLLFSFEDEERLRAWPAKADVRPDLVLDDGTLRFAVPVPYALLLAPFVVVSPTAGPLVANLALLALLLVVAYRSLDRLADDDPAWMLVAAVFGTALALYLRTSLPTLFLAAATAVSVALFARNEPAVGRRLRDMYPGEPRLAGSVGAWLVGGALLAVVALHHPVYLVLLAVPLAFAPRARPAEALACAVLGAAAVMGLAVWLGGGPWTHLGLFAGEAEQVRISVAQATASIERTTLAPPASDEWRLSLERPQLAGWNALYALVGRHVGILPYFPLLLWLAVRSVRGPRRRVLAVAALLGIAGVVLFRPFDFAGLPAALGPRLFVPFFVALWWVPARPPGRSGAGPALLAGLAILWPLWLPGVAPLAAVAGGLEPAGPVLARLPYETSQKDLPARGELVTRDLFVRALSGLEAGGRVSQLRMLGDDGGELLLAAERLERLELRFGSGAGTELTAGGWTVEETMLAPGGEVVFTLRPTRSPRRHPMWWSDEDQEVRLLRFSLDAAAGTTLSIRSLPVDSGP